MTVRKIALNVVKTEGYNSGSIDILARWVFVETDNNDRSDTVYGNVEFPYSSSWMLSIQIKAYASKRTSGDKKGQWIDYYYNLGANLEMASYGRLDEIAKKMKSIETKLSKHEDKYGSANTLPEYLFRIALVTKTDFILTTKRESSGYNFRANTVDGNGLDALRRTCELPIVETVVVEE